MEGETLSLSYSCESRKSVGSVNILVVDDDTTCLSVVAATLKKFKYEVVTAKHPKDALCTLRIKGEAFDLVVSDVHMPDMNGFELQQAISQEFNLPVVLMSADKKEVVVSKGMENGAAFFISKPVCPDDLRDLWQFAAMKKTSAQVVVEETAGPYVPEERTSSADKSKSYEITVSASTGSEWRHDNEKDSWRKPAVKEGSDEKGGDNSQSKKPKVVWNNALHNRFLEAIRTIGLERSVPKKILEVMNVPGLTRENVASHLQKYRIFLRRVSDASYKIHHPDAKGLIRTSRYSSSASFSSAKMPRSPSVLIPNRSFSQSHFQNSGQYFQGANGAPSPNQEASPHGLIAQPGFGQTQFFSRYEGSLVEPDIRNGDMIHQNDGLSSGLSVSFDDPILGLNPSISHQASSHNIISTLPSKNFAGQTSYVGYRIMGSSREYDDGTINLHCPEFQDNIVNAALQNDNVNSIDQSLFQSLAARSSFQLPDVIADHQNLLPIPNIGLPGDITTAGQVHELAFSSIHNLPAFDHIMHHQQALNKGDHSNIQNQAQSGGTITTSSFNQWENRASSFDHQAASNQQQGQTQSNNTTLTSDTNEHCSDDDFLASLLAFGPNDEEDQNLEGILKPEATA